MVRGRAARVSTGRSWLWPALLLILLCYVLLALRVWQVRYVASDIYRYYWPYSVEWQRPPLFHLPLYPLLIAGVRGVLPAGTAPLVILMGINLVAFLGCLGCVYDLLRTPDDGLMRPTVGMLLFAFWPLVGLTYVVNPLADTPALFFFLAGLVLLRRERLLGAALCLGLALITHKLMWLFVGALVVGWLFTRPRPLLHTMAGSAFLLLAPLALTWLAGYRAYGRANWLIAANADEELAAGNAWPLLDGVLRSLQYDGWQGWLRVGFVALFAVLALWVAYTGLRAGNWDGLLGAAIAAPLLLLPLVLTYRESTNLFAIIRYSRLLAVPLVWQVAARPEWLTVFSRPWFRPVLVALLLALLASQFLYQEYLIRLG